MRAQSGTAREFGEQLLEVAERHGDPALFVEAHTALGQTLCILGEPSLAQQHLRRAIASYEPQRHRALAFNYGYDPGAYARAVEGWVLWLLGHPEQALRRSREALALARDRSHPFNSSLMLAMAAVLRQLRQEGEATLEQVRASLALSTEHGFPYLQAVGTILHGWGVAKEGQLERRHTIMRSASTKRSCTS